ncbi:hypothetical protein BKA67DRAFT_541230 [Truncatella angustata]|uniref:Uncharacterized protein n=1 Tax=Truncatella angustata TaxID=152316 RepID=A0A9P8RN33_9PEZI|nr:uncharacterized protein BKA67DRAFT_541230 [Truncatella angustata]KAH6646255.1 hypothetical protein BKA67DRAFT_541230 [Truncatella angustata]
MRSNVVKVEQSRICCRDDILNHAAGQPLNHVEEQGAKPSLNTIQRLHSKTTSANTVIRDLLPDITTFTIPFNRFAPLGYRKGVAVDNLGTAIKLHDNRILVLYPLPLDPSVRRKLNKLRGVNFIVADSGHHIVDQALTHQDKKRATEWDIQRILPRHGDVLDEDGNDAFKSACR